MASKTLSVVIPAYNEEKYIASVIDQVLKVPVESLGFKKEVVVVDDGSKDNTYRIANSFPQVKTITQSNQGKGRAVQAGIGHCSGDYVLVQDADLEYEINDYLAMLERLNEAPDSAIYGSRTRGQIERLGKFRLFPGKHPDQGVLPWLAGLMLSLWTFLLYGKWISDTLTAYKIYPTAVLKGFRVKTHGFETDHELTAKLIRSGVAIHEVPIAYSPRTVAEGKKIGFRDAVKAVWTLARFRFVD